jgi:hypothetical protein
MPRLTSLTERLVTGSSQRSAVVSKVFTGTDFSASHSTWSFGTGTVSLVSSTLPYHSYGNADNDYTPQTQSCNRTWPLRAGTNQTTFVINTLTNQLEPSTATVATTTGTNIGYWLNGVNMYNPSAVEEAPNGYLSFTGLSYNAGYDIAKDLSYDLNADYAGGHWDANRAYHYHDYSFKNAWTTGSGHVSGPYGTTGTAEIALISYLSTSTGGLVQLDGHSKILGWSMDGYPVYGPYGYNQPLDRNSGVRIMTSGYAVYNAASAVAARVTAGVYDTATYPLGIFVQDYYYAGGADLDICNGRYCVTPEYPNGTYAYFVTINPSTRKTVYPYVIGHFYKSTPVLGGQTASDSTNGGGSTPKQTS